MLNCFVLFSFTFFASLLFVISLIVHVKYKLNRMFVCMCLCIQSFRDMNGSLCHLKLELANKSLQDHNCYLFVCFHYLIIIQWTIILSFFSQFVCQCTVAMSVSPVFRPKKTIDILLFYIQYVVNIIAIISFFFLIVSFLCVFFLLFCSTSVHQ